MSVESGWTLSGAAFERLLAMLADDRESAAVAYGQLRTRIAGLMRWWGAADPETLADLALDRAARKLQDGAPVERGDFGAYVRGVSRMVYYEAARVPAAIAAEVEVVADDTVVDPVPLDCLDECLDSLSADDRRLVLRYYDGANQIAVRRELSHELGISPTALRIRTHRLRTRLEGCVTTCVRRK